MRGEGFSVDIDLLQRSMYVLSSMNSPDLAAVMVFAMMGIDY